MYSIEEIKELAKTVSEYKLGKIKIKTDDEELVIEGKCCHKHHSMPPVMPPMAQAAPMAMPAAPAEASAEAPAAPAAKSGNVVKAPIVGTFYAAASPEDAPFVKVGDTDRKSVV